MKIKTSFINNNEDIKEWKFKFDQEDLTNMSNDNIFGIIGKNATGKTLLLSAMGLSMYVNTITQEQFEIALKNEFYAINALHKYSNIAHIEICFLFDDSDKSGGIKRLTTELIVSDENNNKIIKKTASLDQVCCDAINDHHSCLMLGYGTKRNNISFVKTPRKYLADPKALKALRVESLVKNTPTQYVNLQDWLPQLEHKRFVHVVSMINQFLAVCDYQLNYKLGENNQLLYVNKEKQDYREFHELSGGYQTFIALINDMMFHIYVSSEAKQKDKLPLAKGIVLIDELEIGLGFNITMALLPLFRKLLPNIRFIISSHDYILAKAIRPANRIDLNKINNNTKQLKLKEVV